jgi:hypothetical protein
MTIAEKKQMNGYSLEVDQAHIPQHELPLNFKLKPVSELPESIDWRAVPNVVSSVKDQGIWVAKYEMKSHMIFQVIVEAVGHFQLLKH